MAFARFQERDTLKSVICQHVGLINRKHAECCKNVVASRETVCAEIVVFAAIDYREEIIKRSRLHREKKFSPTARGQRDTVEAIVKKVLLDRTSYISKM